MEIDKKPPSKVQDTHQQPKDDKLAQTLIPTKNPASLVSYYAGVFGLLPLFGLPATVIAIIFGVKALKRYKINPTPGAKGHAIAGLVLGGIQVLTLIAFLLVVVFL